MRHGSEDDNMTVDSLHIDLSSRSLSFSQPVQHTRHQAVSYEDGCKVVPSSFNFERQSKAVLGTLFLLLSVELFVIMFSLGNLQS